MNPIVTDLLRRLTEPPKPQRKGCWCCGVEDSRTSQGYWFCEQHQHPCDETEAEILLEQIHD